MKTGLFVCCWGGVKGMHDRGSLFTLCCHSEKPQATWESRGRERCAVRGRLSAKIEILTSRAQHAPQNDRRNGFIFPNQILRYISFHSE